MPSTAVFSTVIKYKVSRIEKDGTIIVDRFEFMEKDGSYIDSDKGTRVSKSGYYSTQRGRGPARGPPAGQRRGAAARARAGGARGRGRVGSIRVDRGAA